MYQYELVAIEYTVVYRTKNEQYHAIELQKIAKTSKPLPDLGKDKPTIAKPSNTSKLGCLAVLCNSGQKKLYITVTT